MTSITVRNVPEDIHRAIKARAALHGRSAQAELLDILEKAAKPKRRLKLGSLLVAIANEAGPLTTTEADALAGMRDKTPAEPVKFE